MLDGDAMTEAELGPGELAAVPKGLWHSPQPIDEVTLVYVTPLEIQKSATRTIRVELGAP